MTAERPADTASQTDDELVALTLRGDRNAYSFLYRRHIDAIYRYIYYRVGNKDDTESLTSDVFLRALRELPKYRGEGRFKNWLYAIAKTIVTDHWRERYRLPTAPLDHLLESAEPPETHDDDHFHDWAIERARILVRSLLDMLPPTQKAVLELRFLNGLSLADTAAALDMSIGNVKVTQYRALRKAAELGRSE